MQIEFQQLLEIGEAVVAAQPDVVAKKEKAKGDRRGLSDDGEVNAPNAASKSEESEDEGK